MIVLRYAASLHEGIKESPALNQDTEPSISQRHRYYISRQPVTLVALGVSRLTSKRSESIWNDKYDNTVASLLKAVLVVRSKPSGELYEGNVCTTCEPIHNTTPLCIGIDWPRLPAVVRS